MDDKLHGKRFLVVGGSSGIGLATATLALRAGAAVTIASRNREKLDAALATMDGHVDAVALDMGDNDAVERYLTNAGVWDHVVVSAAQTRSGLVRSLSMADAMAAMESKFWGPYRIARAVQIHDAGSLTLVSGALSVRPAARAVLQGSINAAVELLAHAWRSNSPRCA